MFGYKQKFSAILLVSILLFGSTASAATNEGREGGFQEAVDGILKTAGSAGIELVSLSSGEAVYQLHQNEPLVPASLVKLLTSYAALKELGPSFRFTTSAYALEEPSGGVVAGDIWIKGSGDPYFIAEKATLFAQALKDRGILQIRGGIFVDDSFFDHAAERICLDGDCSGSYNPVVSAAAFDFNQYTVRLTIPAKSGKTFGVESSPAGYARVTGRASVVKKGGNSIRLTPIGASANGQEEFRLSGQGSGRGGVREFRYNAADPAGLFAHAIRAALQRSGISVRGPATVRGACPEGAKVIADYDSPPLSEIISVMNKYSNNFMAEMLLRSLGGYLSGAPGSADKGVAAAKAALRKSGIPQDTGILDCGSGLSRFCRVSPDTFSRLLVSAWNDPTIKSEFVSSLAANAEEGTLRRRMRKPGLIVRGKTGTLNDVIGFAGYVSGPSGKTFAVVVMLNDVRDRARARQAIDSFLEEVAFSN